MSTNALKAKSKRRTVQEWRNIIARIPQVARSAAEREYMERMFNFMTEEQHPADFGRNIVKGSK
jgi:hypothetical protein